MITVWIMEKYLVKDFLKCASTLLYCSVILSRNFSACCQHQCQRQYPTGIRNDSKQNRMQSFIEALDGHFKQVNTESLHRRCIRCSVFCYSEEKADCRFRLTGAFLSDWRYVYYGLPEQILAKHPRKLQCRGSLWLPLGKPTRPEKRAEGISFFWDTLYC